MDASRNIYNFIPFISICMQLPVCRVRFRDQGRLMLEQDWREHLLKDHGEDLRILTHLAQELYDLEISEAGRW